MILSNTVVYLCGQVENDPEAAGWRKDIASSLTAINPLITVWDPLLKPEWVDHDVCDEEVAFKWKKHVLGDSDLEKGEQCYSANRSVRRLCKQLANKCDWMIARISKTFTWGSIDELEIAASRKIPVFMWLPDGLISIYGLAGCVHTYENMSHYVHMNVDSLLNSISAIDKGEINIVERDPEVWMRLAWNLTPR